MRTFSATPAEMLASLVRNWQLILQLSRREILIRYSGSVMGWLWSIFHPLFMLTVYTIVFSGVFNTQWSTGSGNRKGDFALFLFVGLIVHGLFAECISRAPALIVNNVSYVKKVVFPLEVMAWVAMGSALFNAAIGFALLLVAQVLLHQHVPPSAALLPVVLLPLVLGVLGLAWFLSSLGVYLRDVSQVAAMFATAMLFLSAVFFPISAIPEHYQPWLRLNPLAVVIEHSRDVLLLGRVPKVSQWLYTMTLGAASAWAGFAVFQKTRRGFANVL